MRIDDIWHIGDPHLGRRFENGVPLHRRGEREAQQWAKFREELNTDCDINICMGDLFDHPQVSMQTIVDAADAYELAARRRPQTQFFVMAGNHDRSRQVNTIGAWEIFKKILAGRLENLFLVDYVGKVETIAFFPWQWGVPVAGALEERFTKHHENVEVEHVVLHHDLESFGGDTSYMVPARLIRDKFPNVKSIVTGHWHIPGSYQVDGIQVECTGSIEPLSHAEDPDGEIYVTLTLDQLESHDLSNKCVRVLLREGEELPVDLDCRALTGKRVTALEEFEPTVAQKLGAFDWQEVLDEHLKDVRPDVRAFIDERLTHS